jgi:hypothetical protein
MLSSLNKRNFRERRLAFYFFFIILDKDKIFSFYRVREKDLRVVYPIYETLSVPSDTDNEKYERFRETRFTFFQTLLGACCHPRRQLEK